MPAPMSVVVQAPVGLFACGDAPPAWATIGTLSDTVSVEEMAHARVVSETRGMRWFLQLGHYEPPHHPIGPHASRIRAKLDASGLLPHIAGMGLNEEWYERFYSGAFAEVGLPSTHPLGIEIVRDWMGAQHVAAFAAIPAPVVWITGLANNDPALGRAVYRPVPTGVHAVAVDAYVPQGGTFATHVAPILAHAETTTTLPLVLIPQWFYAPDDPLWSRRPTESDIEAYAAWSRRPRWVATIGFVWLSQPCCGIVGLADMPAERAAVERAWGMVQ